MSGTHIREMRCVYKILRTEFIWLSSVEDFSDSHESEEFLDQMRNYIIFQETLCTVASIEPLEINYAVT